MRYNSIAPLDERLKSTAFALRRTSDSADFLMALRGARVEVRSGSATATGRLLSVEKERKANGKGDFYDVTEFSIVSDAGEMRNFDLGPGTSVPLAERDLSDEIGRYLNLIGSSRARDLRRMTISADRNGRPRYFCQLHQRSSHLEEYLPHYPAGQAQREATAAGWAIVDNTVGEDWKDVQLSLVAGAPQSFIQDISQPYYARRPVVALPESVMLSPQTHEATMNARRFRPRRPLSPGTSRRSPGYGQGSIRRFRCWRAESPFATRRPAASQTAVTDAKARYHLYNVPAGNSALFVDCSGFSDDMRSFQFLLGVGPEKRDSRHPPM